MSLARGNNYPTVKKGGRTKVKTSDGSEYNYDPREEITPVDPNGQGPLASVGIALTVGQSSDYAKEKIEVSVWCTIPCAPNPDAIQEAYEYCYDYVSTEVEQRSDAAVEKFFPHLLEQT